MKKITNAAALKEHIAQLEIQKDTQRKELKEHFALVRESFRPANLIKSTVREVASAPGVGGKFAGTLIGLLAGFVAKRAVFGATHNPLKQIAGTLLQMGIAGTITKNSGGLKTLGTNLLSRILKRNKKNRQEVLDNVDEL